MSEMWARVIIAGRVMPRRAWQENGASSRALSFWREYGGASGRKHGAGNCNLPAAAIADARVYLFLSALRKRLTVGVRAVLLDGDKVLLIQHTYVPGWQFPGRWGRAGRDGRGCGGARGRRRRPAMPSTGRPVAARLLPQSRRRRQRATTWRSMSGASFEMARPFARNLEIAECELVRPGGAAADDVDPGHARGACARSPSGWPRRRRW